MIQGSINLSKVDKSLLKKSQKGEVFLNFVLWKNKDGPDTYGKEGTLKHNTSKQQRAEGLGQAIIGNWEYMDGMKPGERKEEAKAEDRPKGAKPTYTNNPEDDIPF